jgi:adenosylcobinamide kinase/adenosylcobinamide-phosphate guanylyltransferase
VKETLFVIGGCRSGKSGHALKAAESFTGEKKIFIATCIPRDDEMRNRVAKHRQERSRTWHTVEAPKRLPDSIIENSRDATVLLVDCLTLWINNLMLETEDSEKVLGQIPFLIQAIETASCPVVLVSNEVGAGIVPENKLARQFRDLAGAVNQAVAKHADKVVWMVAGIPVSIKGRQGMTNDE